MLWSIVSVAVVGFWLGLGFRVPALLAATALTILVTALFLHGPLWQRVLLPVLALQCAYLVGLAVGEILRRRPNRHH